jgi:hypothetical protein
LRGQVEFLVFHFTCNAHNPFQVPLMAKADHDVLALLRGTPWIAGGAALFLAASTFLFGARYLSFLVGAVLGAISLVFVLVSFWKRNPRYQTFATVVILSGMVGMMGAPLPALQTLATAMLVVSLPLALSRGAIVRKWGDG